MADGKLKVTVIGSGNWGATIAKIVSLNVLKTTTFDHTVKMWVYEELVDGRKMSDILNEHHENIKYLPGIKIPDNVVAVPDMAEAVGGADILIFVLPYKYIREVCERVQGKVKKDVFACSLIKGLAAVNHQVQRVSQLIQEVAGVEVSGVLLGANVSIQVAKEEFCEATLGCRDEKRAKLFYQLFSCPYFRIKVTKDMTTVEICGATKNVVAVAAGFCDGLGYGCNTKSAVMRIGLVEMWKFANKYCNGSGVQIETFFESCGVADIITTSLGGRNKKVAEAFISAENKSIDELEEEMLDGQVLQGPMASREINKLLKAEGKEHETCSKQLLPRAGKDCSQLVEVSRGLLE